MFLKQKLKLGEVFDEFEEQEKCDARGKDLFLVVKNDSEKRNHERAWAMVDKKITQGKLYNYYLLGRVEIGKGKATIFLNLALNEETIVEKICRLFGLTRGSGLTNI